MEILTFDLEIIKCIPDNRASFTGYEYCAGWRDFENMGISCAAYAVGDTYPVVFDWEDASAREQFLDAIINADIIAGFNSVNFDDRLLAANGVECRTNYDLLFECRLAAYGSFDYHDQPEGHSYALDPICRANGLTKTGSGSLAPQWWQSGDRERVRKYCANDVAIERAALKMALGGKLINPNTGDIFNVRPLAAYDYGDL